MVRFFLYTEKIDNRRSLLCKSRKSCLKQNISSPLFTAITEIRRVNLPTLHRKSKWRGSAEENLGNWCELTEGSGKNFEIDPNRIISTTWPQPNKVETTANRHSQLSVQIEKNLDKPKSVERNYSLNETNASQLVGFLELGPGTHLSPMVIKPNFGEVGKREAHVV